MDTVKWPQEMGLVKPSMEEMVSISTIVTNTTTSSCSTRLPSGAQVIERRTRPPKEQALNCPRCNSTHTKFCYYNNYSLTQPRYFCKTCRRYWTEGGSLRNVPVGGGSRKNSHKKSSSSTSSLISSSAVSSCEKQLPHDHLTPPHTFPTPTQNPKFHEGQDLNLAFLGEFHNMEENMITTTTTTSAAACSSATSTSAALSAMEMMSGMSASDSSPFMQAGGVVYPTVFGLQDFRSNLTINNCPPVGVGGGGCGYASGNMMQAVQEEGNGKVFFPFENLRQQVSSAYNTGLDQNRGQGGDPPEYWNGVSGGGGALSWGGRSW